MKAIFAGTFDPFTLGHREIVRRAAELFGAVTVAIHSDGRATVDAKARAEIARLSLKDIDGATVETFSGLLTDYIAAKKEKCVLVRGLRNMRDFDYERELDAAYKALGGVESVYLMTDLSLAHVSSTNVRELVKFGAPIDGYVFGGAIAEVEKYYGKERRA